MKQYYNIFTKNITTVLEKDRLMTVCNYIENKDLINYSVRNAHGVLMYDFYIIRFIDVNNFLSPSIKYMFRYYNYNISKDETFYLCEDSYDKVYEYKLRERVLKL